MNEHQFEARLSAMEHRFKISLLAIISMILLLGTEAVKPPSAANVVRARKLIIVDSAGRERIEMSVSEPVPGSSEPYLTLRSVRGGEDGTYNRYGWHVKSSDGEADLIGPNLTLSAPKHHVFWAKNETSPRTLVPDAMKITE